MNWPGRALSYKIGQLKIEELRDKSKTELGSKFSLKNFHDAFLKGGFMQFNIFEGISLVNPQFYYSKKVLKGLLI